VAAEQMPTLSELAATARMSHFHFHRVFRAVMAMTPKAYGMAYRAKRVRDELHGSSNITGAVFDAGYTSTGQFYAQAPRLLGMTPKEYRTGGVGAELQLTTCPCWLGSLLVAGTKSGCLVLLGENPTALVAELRACFPYASITSGDTRFAIRLEAIVSDAETWFRPLNLPVEILSTALQQYVWQQLRDDAESPRRGSVRERVPQPSVVPRVSSSDGPE
jgi:AraC family transcriptional regulator of adaptative response/methylated-DNA-[protein]-cysteine methyltransferase